MKTKTTRNTEQSVSNRTSLYSFNSRERHADDISSILDELEPRLHKHAIWWRTILVGVVILLATALYMVGSDVDIYRHLSPAVGEEIVVGRTVVKQEMREPLQSAAPAANIKSSVEAVVVESSVHHAEPQASRPLNLATEDRADTVIADDAENNAIRSPVTASEQKNVALNSGSDEGQLKEKEATPPSPKKESKPAPRPRGNVKTTAGMGSGKGSDADPIAVLASRISRDEVSGKGIGNKHAKEAGDARSGNLSGNREEPGLARRDIVVRNDGDSTEVLVKRCRELGFIEGELCRLRICSGLWGTDPACPGASSGEQQSTSGR